MIDKDSRMLMEAILDYMKWVKSVEDQRGTPSHMRYTWILVDFLIYVIHKSIAWEKMFTVQTLEAFRAYSGYKGAYRAIKALSDYLFGQGRIDQPLQLSKIQSPLWSSASSEALHYFQEALQLYLTQYGNDADPAKLANIEKNIALAFYNKAQWAEAVKYFSSVLERWETPLPKRRLAGIMRTLWDLLVIMKMVYWKFPNSRKIPGKQDKEVIELLYRVVATAAFYDSTKYFQAMIALLRHISKFDSSKIPEASNYWVAGSCVFSVSGLSFGLSNRLLEVSKHYGILEDIDSRMKYTCFSTTIHHCQGTWGKITDLDEELLNSSLRIGDFWHPSNYLIAYGVVKEHQGEFGHLMKVIDKLFQIGETYDYAQANSNARGLKTRYLVMVRSVHEALSEAEKWLAYSREKSTELHEIIIMALKAEAQQLAGDAEGANYSLSQASEIFEKQSSVVIRGFVSPYVASCFFVTVEQLKHAIRSKTSSDVAQLRKHAYKVGKAAVRNSRKYAPYRTKIWRLMGLYYWLIGKQTKALKWWDKSIQEGERLGARPDLSRTYFEVGKRLLEPQSKYKEFNGIDARGYLEKARTMFEEMGLERDLDELDRITS